MKKFVIVMLVLAMASMANGKMLYYTCPGLTWNATNSWYDVSPNVSITINVRGDYDAASFGVGAVKITATQGGDFSSVAIGTVNALFDAARSGGTIRSGASYGVYITGISGSKNITSPLVPADSMFYTFSLTTGSTVGDKIYIDDYQGTVWGGAPRQTTVDGTQYDSVNGMAAITLTIPVIPEPMTVLLLGLGGLFLRRRK